MKWIIHLFPALEMSQKLKQKQQMLALENSLSLKQILEQANPDFAYEVLSLQIDIQNCESSGSESKEQQKNNVNNITQLIGLYMMAVEALEGVSDPRYKHFSKKIQTMMSKKHIVEELHRASTGRKSSGCELLLAPSKRAKEKERRSEYDLQIFFNKEQFDCKKVKEMVQTADDKYQTIQNSITSEVRKQEDAVHQRHKSRKMRSESGTISRVKYCGQKNSPHYQINEQDEFQFHANELTDKLPNGNHHYHTPNEKNSRTNSSLEKKCLEKKRMLLKKQSQGFF